MRRLIGIVAELLITLSMPVLVSAALVEVVEGKDISFSFAEYPVAWPTPPKRLRRLDCGDEGEEEPSIALAKEGSGFRPS